jgi:tetratricopeptide (TPR) repeat protein
LKKYFILIFTVFIVNSYALDLSSGPGVAEIIDKFVRFDKWREAKSAFENYLKSNPTDTYAYSVYANVLGELKLYDDAIIAARTGLNYEKTDEAKGGFYNQLGYFYYSKKINDLALDMYKKSSEYSKNLDSSYYMQGLIYAEKNDYDSAILSWKNYIAVTNNLAKREKMQALLSKLEKKITDEKMKKEEEKKLKEEYLKKLTDELDKEKADSKSLEADKNKTKKSGVELEEIE